jgi:predicted TPR repeat methyltransferase
MILSMRLKYVFFKHTKACPVTHFFGYDMIEPFLNMFQRFASKRMFAGWSPIYEAEVTDNAYSAANAVTAAVIPFLSESTERPHILDVGIGTGLVAQQIYDSVPCRIAGIDFSPDMMSICAAKEITETLVQCDAGKDRWPFADRTFSLVLAAGLHEYLTPSMLRHFLKEALRVTQHKAFLVFTYIPLERGSKRIKLWQGHSGTYLACSYESQEIESLLKTTGFDILNHSSPFKGSVFQDGSSYPYRLIAAQKS